MEESEIGTRSREAARQLITVGLNVEALDEEAFEDMLATAFDHLLADRTAVTVSEFKTLFALGIGACAVEAVSILRAWSDESGIEAGELWRRVLAGNDG